MVVIVTKFHDDIAIIANRLCHYKQLELGKVEVGGGRWLQTDSRSLIVLWRCCYQVYNQLISRPALHIPTNIYMFIHMKQ
jgi:hypothetical protein